MLSEELLSFLYREKRGDPKASVPELIRRAKQAGVLAHDPDRTTVWRALGRMGIELHRRNPHPDTRRFEAADRLHLVIADGKQFRAGRKRRRRVAMYFLDDATRYGLDVVVGTSEDTALVLAALEKVLRRHGLFLVLYVDRGSGFIANDLAIICARLDIHLILGSAGYPEGRGKVERFNRSVKARLLRSYDGADIDTDLGALTIRLRHDLWRVYNHLPHESLKQETPHHRFTQSESPLRPIPPDPWLAERFSVPERRLVSKDHIIQFGGKEYEVPSSYPPGPIDFLRRPLERDALLLPHDGRLIRLQPVDKVANAKSRRAQPKDQEDPSLPPPKTASTLAFEADHRSMLGPDGGYPDYTEITEEKPS